MTAAGKPAVRDLDLSRARWRRSPQAAVGEEAVEIAYVHGHIAMRNSTDPDTPPLVFTPEEWAAFSAGVRDGEFDFGNGLRSREQAHR